MLPPQDKQIIINCIFDLLSVNFFRVCLNGMFKREKEGRIHFSFLNYEHYKIFF